MGKDIDLNEVITRNYAYKLIVKCTIIFVIGAILTATILYFSIYKNPGTSYAESYRIISELRNKVLHKSLYIYGFSSLFIITGIILVAILYSHRVAGPVYRLEHYAQKIKNGHLSIEVKIRQKDAIHPVANELDNLTTKYRVLLAQLELKSKGIRDATLLIQKSSGHKFKENVANISESVIEIKKMLHDIKL